MTAADAVGPLQERSRRRLPLAVTLAWRELRAGLSGFAIFIACIALGVAVIAGVGAASDGLRAGFERQGETILGGDLTVSRTHVRATDAERAVFDGLGQVSESATMRTMARRIDGADQALAELKFVDDRYPLVGEVKLAGGEKLQDVLREGIAVEPVLLERLSLKAGDSLKLGNAEVKIAGIVKSEPDGISDRMTYGPRIFAPQSLIDKTGLVKPGTLIRWRYALKLDAERAANSEEIASARRHISAELPEAGVTVVDRRDPSPQISRTLDRLRQFLTLIGLTALLVGGVGVANAVSTFIDKRRKTIATMKSIGATSRTVIGIFLVQIGLVTAIGVAIGLLAGTVLPVALKSLYGDALPIRLELTVSPFSIVAAIVYGFAVALLFALWPLARIEQVSATVLFRDEVSADVAGPWPRPWAIAATVLVALALLAFAMLTSDSKRVAFYFAIGIVIVFAVFVALGAAVTRAARMLPRSRRPEIALALRNLGAPGGLTRSIVLSLGTGLSLLAAVALVNASLIEELRQRLPSRSPDYFVIDVSPDDFPAISALMQKQFPGVVLDEAPMLRGRLIALNDTPVEELKAPPEAQWVLNGDRGLSYSIAVPRNSKVVAGEWWPADYAGEPLVSFESELAGKLGLKLGDTVTVNVLGRNVTAKIANLREVRWESLAINFVMVFSPNTLQDAPYNDLVTISLPKGVDLKEEAQGMRVLEKAYPSITAIRVRDALDAFSAVFTKVMVAVRAAGGVTLAAGALVLAGALATAQRRRILEAVILKTLGATRRQILLSHAAEYLLLAGITALFAVLLGSIAAAVITTQLMNISFSFSAAAVAGALALATALVLVFGGIGTFSVLRARPVPYLRTE